MATFGQFIQFGPYYRSGVLVSTLHVYHYTAGTLTLKDVYSDRGKSSTAAQPLVSDSNGIATCYADGLYKFIIKDGSDSTTLYTDDNWAVTDSTLSASGEGTALASAATVTLDGTGDFHHITGSTGPITAISGSQSQVTFCFDATPGLTNSGNLILPGGRDLTAVAGDLARFQNEGSGVWRCTNYLSTAFAPTVQPVTTNGFRLSLTTGLPVTTSDVTAAGTLYAVPLEGNYILVYVTGRGWVMRQQAQFSLALTATSGKPYDVFVYDNSGTPTIETLVWTNDTTRATALAYDSGLLIKSGDATRRYLGTLYASGANTTEDSMAKRYLWNYYHRVSRPMKAIDTTDSWTYTTDTYRQFNGAAANQLDFVVGVAEDLVESTAIGHALQSTSTIAASIGIGLDSTTVNSAVVFGGGSAPTFSGVMTTGMLLVADYQAIVAAGRHVLVPLEKSAASNTTTWYGDNGSTNIQTGIVGWIRG